MLTRNGQKCRPSMAATVIEMLRMNVAWLKTKEGQDIMRIAQAIVKGSDWESVVYPSDMKPLPKNLFRFEE